MINRITRRRYVIGSAVVALAVCVLWGGGWLQPAKARAQSNAVFVFHTNFGIIPGQMLRITVVNPAASPERGPERETFETNFFGVFRVTKALLPLIRRSDSGRIVNMSSELGSLADLSNPESASAGFTGFAYCASKVALNALTVLFAKELRGARVKINSADPGWVKTDMGTSAAPLTPEQGADTPVWLATLPADGPTGGFFSSRQPMAW